MPSYRYRDDEAPTSQAFGVLAGALAGFAVGVLVAQRIGGFAGLTARLRGRADGTTDALLDDTAPHRGLSPEVADYDDYDDYDDVEPDTEEDEVMLEERVLEAFRNDPVLSERAVDIGAIGEGIVELAGWVDTPEEAAHAVTLARGVPGVDTVVNRLVVGDEEERLGDNARRVAEGDPALTEAHWEGQQVGTGRRRQGTSKDVDRHADPKVNLEDRWLNEREAMKNAAEDMEGIAERRQRTAEPEQGDRTGGAAVAPTGVPKGDHVANPKEADRQTAQKEAARDTTRDVRPGN